MSARRDRGADAAFPGDRNGPGDSFQREFLAARSLDGEEVEQAIRHGLEAQPRFADRPFSEVEDYLRESWVGLGSTASWDDVRDIVRSSYEWQRAEGVGRSIVLGEDATDRFGDRTIGGSHTGGTLD